MARKLVYVSVVILLVIVPAFSLGASKDVVSKEDTPKSCAKALIEKKIKAPLGQSYKLQIPKTFGP